MKQWLGIFVFKLLAKFIKYYQSYCLGIRDRCSVRSRHLRSISPTTFTKYKGCIRKLVHFTFLFVKRSSFSNGCWKCSRPGQRCIRPCRQSSSFAYTTRPPTSSGTPRSTTNQNRNLFSKVAGSRILKCQMATMLLFSLAVCIKIF